jgi:EAL domain-containing protein (putative c-di-GMP-specific phosphodiesterase class I)
VGALLELAAFAAPLLAPQLAAREDLEGARAAIRLIVRDGRFHPVFQPIVRLDDRSTVGFEALTRFDDGTPPDVRFAEAAALGVGIDLEVACLRAALAAGAGLPTGTWLSLNATGAMIRSGRLRTLLRRVDRDVVVELTEHVAVDDYPALRAAVESLGPRVRLAVDDAGAGFAGLRHVVELRPHIVKLDAAIVRGIDGDPVRQSLVAGMLHYARATGTYVVAEGIEAEAEATTLAGLDVRFAQGYLFARPAPLAELVTLGHAA